VKRLERGDSLELRNASSRTVFWRFLLSRHVIEAAFIQALADGLCRDFHSFTQLRLDLFYNLDQGPELTPRAGHLLKRAAS
jgi:hypothetical protein